MHNNQENLVYTLMCFTRLDLGALETLEGISQTMSETVLLISFPWGPGPKKLYYCLISFLLL